MGHATHKRKNGRGVGVSIAGKVGPPTVSAEIELGLLNLHDAFLNASLVMDRMKQAPIERDVCAFLVSDRARLERLWVALLAVLVESWNCAQMKPVKTYISSITSIRPVVEALRRARRDGTLGKMLNVRHYMFHRDKRLYWDNGRTAVCRNLGVNRSVHAAFAKVLLLAMARFGAVNTQ